MSTPKPASGVDRVVPEPSASPTWNTLTFLIPTTALVGIHDVVSSSTHWLQQGVWNQIHPGHASVIFSLPFCYQAYQGYQQSLESMVQSVLAQHRIVPAVALQDMSQLEDSVRRSIASAVAARALKVATLGCFGALGLSIGASFYITQTSSLQDLLETIRHWAHRHRSQWDTFLLAPSSTRIDERHPEYQLVQQMTEEEELDYINKTYFPQNEDWGLQTEDSTASDLPKPEISSPKSKD
jgi:hypothetical protein